MCWLRFWDLVEVGGIEPPSAGSSTAPLDYSFAHLSFLLTLRVVRSTKNQDSVGLIRGQEIPTQYSCLPEP